jgi:hypothetical protein
MTSPDEKDYSINPYKIMIKPNQWISSNRYKDCELLKLNDKEYNFYYGTTYKYSAWVHVISENGSWVYYPIGNKLFKSKSYTWLGDLFDDAIESMIGAKI